MTIRPLKAKRLVNILAEREAEVKVDTVIETLGNVEAYSALYSGCKASTSAALDTKRHNDG